MTTGQAPVRGRFGGTGLKRRLFPAALAVAALLPLAMQLGAVGSFFLHDVNNEMSRDLWFVALTAHLTWLLGGLHLLFWHKRRLARRLHINLTRTSTT